MKGRILESLYDHWIVIFSTLAVGLISTTKVYLPLVANFQVPLWICAIVIVAAILLTIYIKTPKRSLKSSFVHQKPKQRIKDYGQNVLFKVSWEIWMGYDQDFSDRRIWASGPFCRQCKYELDDWEDAWFCVPCEKRYKIPKHVRSCPREKAIKVFEAQVQSSSGLMSTQV